MADPANPLGRFDLPFAEQIDFFRQKTNLPTAKWDDIWQAAHDRAFVVAGAAKADLLDDLRQAVDLAITKGTTLETFRDSFRQIVFNRGWHGWTGEGSEAGFNWRTKVIYETNLRASYAAGREAQLADPGLQKLLPYRRYIHNDSVLNPRPLHLAWNGLTLPHDHEFWKTHSPPNGWGCRCRTTAVAAPKKGDPTEPPAGWNKPGEDGTLPGIDKGWGYAPGASVKDELRALVESKVGKLPGPIAADFRAEITPVVGGGVLPSTAGAVPTFIEAKTAREAAEWAVKNNLADFADYTGIKPEVANSWNRSLLEHLREFPELRPNQKFIGSCQAQAARWREFEMKEYIEALRRANPHVPSNFDFRPYAEQAFKLPKIDGDTWAHSMDHKDVSGVAVNSKWGGDVPAFKRALRTQVDIKYHPVGCDSIKSVIDHEFGHQVDDLLGLHLDADVVSAYKEAMQAGITEEVSQYAAKNVKEFIAECWTESRNNPAPRRFSARIASIVRQRYADKFGGA